MSTSRSKKLNEALGRFNERRSSNPNTYTETYNRQKIDAYADQYRKAEKQKTATNRLVNELVNRQAKSNVSSPAGILYSDTKASGSKLASDGYKNDFFGGGSGGKTYKAAQTNKKLSDIAEKNNWSSKQKDAAAKSSKSANADRMNVSAADAQTAAGKYSGQTMKNAKAGDLAGRSLYDADNLALRKGATGNPYGVDLDKLYNTDDISEERRAEYRKAAEQDPDNPLMKAISSNGDSVISAYERALTDPASMMRGGNVLSDAARSSMGSKVQGPQAARNGGIQTVESMPYNFMTNEEKNRYNEIYGIYGKEAAEDYKDLLMDELNQRRGETEYQVKHADDNTALKAANQFYRGAASGINGIIDSAAAFTGNTTPRAKEWQDYMVEAMRNDPDNSTAQNVIFDIAQSTGYMAPGIAASALTAGAGAAPAVAGLIGNSVFALAQYGNTYQDDINAGRNKSASQLHALQQGIDEAATNYILGGIGAFGGGALKKIVAGKGGSKLLNSAVSRLTKNEAARKTLVRLADYMADAGSEAAQEYTQYFTNAITENLLFNAGNDLSLLNEEAMYSALLGALNSAALNLPGNAIGAAEDVRSARRESNANTQTTNMQRIAAELAEKEATGRRWTDTDRLNADYMDSNPYGSIDIGRAAEYERRAGGSLDNAAASGTRSADISRQAAQTDSGIRPQTAAQNYNTRGIEPGTYSVRTSEAAMRVDAPAARQNEMQALRNDAAGSSNIPAISNEAVSRETENLPGNMSSDQAETAAAMAGTTPAAVQAAQTMPGAGSTAAAEQLPGRTDTVYRAPAAATAIDNTVTAHENRAKTADNTVRPSSSSAVNAASTQRNTADNAASTQRYTAADQTIRIDNSPAARNARKTFKAYSTEHSASLYTKSSNDTMVSLYDGSRDMHKYLSAYKEAYAAGFNGVEPSVLEKRPEMIYLNAAQRARAYSDGMRDSNLYESRKLEYEKGEARRGGVTEGAELIDRNKRRFLDWAGNKTGLKIEVREGLKGAAEIDRQKGVMRINPYAEDFVGSTSHELTHLIKEYAPKEYDKLQRLTIESLMESEDVSYEELYAKYERAYREENSDYTMEDILEEITADGATAFLNDAEFAEKVAREDRSLAKKIADFFKDIADTLRAIINERGIRKVGRVMRENEARYREAADIWYSALEKAGTKYKEGYTASETSGSKYQINKEYADQVDEWARNGMDEKELFILGSTGNVLQGLGARENDIYMRGSKLKEILQKHPEMSLDTLKRIPEILENPNLVLKTQNKAATRAVVFGDVIAANGQSVLAVLEFDAKENGISVDDMQKVNSAYTKTIADPAEFLKKSEVLYANKKATQTVRRMCLNYHTQQLLSGFIGNIHYIGDDVKLTGKKFSEVFDLSSNTNTATDQQSNDHDITSIKDTAVLGIHRSSEEERGRIRSVSDADSVASKSETGKTKFQLNEPDYDPDVNHAMTMAQARHMIETAYNVNSISDAYGYKNADEWINEMDSNGIAYFIGRVESLMKKHAYNNRAIPDDYTMGDVVEAYKKGILTGRPKPVSKKLDLSKDTGITDDRFYAPQNAPTITQDTYQTAELTLSNDNYDEVTAARRDILFASYNGDISGELGISAEELDKKLIKWSCHNKKAKIIAERINRNVALQNQWHGIQNCAMVSQFTVRSEDVESLVKGINGTGRSYELKHIAKTMLAIDTHTDWSWLTFEFVDGRAIENEANTRGYFDGSNVVIGGIQAADTVAHEMGHALAQKWTNDLYGDKATTIIDATSAGVIMNRIRDTDARIFAEHWMDLLDDITEVQDIRTVYTASHNETFARFVANFVRWTNETAGTTFPEHRFDDHFTESQYIRFAKLLQEKSLLDNKLAEGSKKFQLNIDDDYAGDISDIDRYNFSKYNRYGWAYVNKLMNKKAAAEFFNGVRDIKNGYNVRMSHDGLYMIETSNRSDGVKDVIVYTDGNYEQPTIEKLIKINAANETEAYELKEIIYDREEQGASALEAYEADIRETYISIYSKRDLPSYRDLSGGTEGARGKGRPSDRTENDNGGAAAEGPRDLRRQLDIDDDADEYSANIVRDSNRELDNAADNLGGFLGYINYVPDNKSIRRTAAELRRYTGTAASVDEISAQLKSIYSYIADCTKVDGRTISDIAADYAGDLITNGRPQYDETDVKLYRQLRNAVKSYTFHMPAGYEGEVKTLGGMNALRREFFGTLNMTKDKGIGIDTMYQELAGQYPDMFDGSIANPADQLEHIVDTLRSRKPQPIRTWDTNADYESFRYYAGQKIFEIYTEPGRMINNLNREAEALNAANAGLEAENYTLRETARKNEADDKEMSALQAKTAELTARNMELNEALKKRTADERELATLQSKAAEYEAKYLTELEASRNKVTRQTMRDRVYEARKATKTRYWKDQILKDAKDLSTWMLKPTDKKHVPEALKQPLANFLSQLDLTSRNLAADGEPTQRSLYWMQLKDTWQRIAENNGTDTQYMVVDTDILSKMSELTDKIKGIKKLEELDYIDVLKLSDVMKAMKKSIETANNMISLNRSVADVSNGTMEHLKGFKTRSIYGGPFGGFRELMTNQMLDADTRFHTFGEDAEAVYSEVRKGFNRKVRHTAESAEWYADILKETGITNKEAAKWSDELHDFTTSDGTKIRISTGQIMNLYNLMKREQARDHVLSGGISLTSNKETESLKNRILKKQTGTENVHVNSADVLKLMDMLTPAQKTFSDKLAATMLKIAEWGNETSMELMGYKKFNDHHYWPIKSSRDYIATSMDQAAAGGIIGVSVKNAGPTKSTVKHANNPVLIGDVTDVWTEHVNFMANYNAFTIPLTDMVKWYNYVDYSDFRTDSGAPKYAGSIKQELGRVFGRESDAFIMHFIEDINGMGKADKSIVNSLVSAFKGSAVAANLSVAIQQPTSIFRSIAEIDAKYVTKGLVHKNHADWETIKKYSAIAQWKDWGFYETNIGKSMKQILVGDVTLYDTISDKQMMLAGKGDEITWKRMWGAAEVQVETEHPELKAGSDAYYRKTAEIFDRVIDRTQVVDSVFTKSDLMRSKNEYNKILTAFFSEPTKSYNMLYRSWFDLTQAKDAAAQKAARKKFATAVMAFLLSNTAAAMAKSIITAMRDKDEDRDKDFWDRWWSHFVDAEIDNINPVNYIPWVKDAYSLIVSGYSSSRPDMNAVTDLSYVVSRWKKYLSGDSKYSLANNILYSAKVVSTFTGIAVYSAERDFNAIVDTMLEFVGADALNYEKQKALGLNVGAAANTGYYLNKAMAAYKEGNTALGDKIIGDMVKAGIEEDKINEKKKTMLKEDPDMQSLTDLTMEGDESGAESARAKLIRNGYDEDLIDSVLTSQLKSRAKEAGMDYNGLNTMLDSITDYTSKSYTEFYDKYEEWAELAKLTNGWDDKKCRQNFRTQCTKHFKSMYKEGDSKERSRIINILTRVKINGEKLYKDEDIKKWADE